MGKQTADHMDQALSNSMKLQEILCRATQDRQVIVESSDKMVDWRRGHFSILALRTPRTVMKRQDDKTLKDELPRLAGMLLEKSGEITPERRHGTEEKTMPSCGCDW